MKQCRGDHRVGLLNLHFFDSADELESRLAETVRIWIVERVAAVGQAGLVISTSPGLEGFMRRLANCDGVPWTRTICYGDGELAGCGEDSPRSLRRRLIENLVRRVPIAEFHGLRGEAANPVAVCRNFARLLDSRPPGLAVLDVGENGELGLFGPGQGDWEAGQPVVRVETRQGRALAIALPALMSCGRVVAACTLPGGAAGIASALEKGFGAEFPASILTRHPDADLFLVR